MPTLFLTPRYSTDAQALWKAAASLGWRIERLANWQIPEELRVAEQPVLYAEALMAPMLAEQLRLQLSQPTEDWLVRLPYEFRRREIELSTLGAARQRLLPAFIKPPNDKAFPAAVYRGAELPPGFDDEAPVLISEVVHWTCEYRCFVLDRQLQTFSLYARHGELQRDQQFHSSDAEDADALEFLQSVLADPGVPLPAATVVDIGLIDGRGWACVEQNAAWGAGLYACDPVAVLRVLERAVSPMPTRP